MTRDHGERRSTPSDGLLLQPSGARSPVGRSPAVCIVVRQSRATTLMVTHSMQQAASLGDRLIAMHRGRVYLDVSGAEKQRLTENDLLGLFIQMRRDDRFDEAACSAIRAGYR